MVRLYRFIGSIYFTILLITLFAGAVIWGTVIESKTGSHKAASRLIYANPLFLMILWGVFVNILVATLKRYPFKKHHIPFIITHIGLLMVFAGALLKLSFGEQGVITLKEGTQTAHFAVDDSRAISMKRRGETNWSQAILTRDLLSRLNTRYTLEGLNFQIKGLAPNGEETFESWIKEDRLVILGEPPLPLNEVGSIGERVLVAAKNPEVIKERLKTLPALIFLEEENGDILAMDVDKLGNFHPETFSKSKLPRLYAYDDGYGGYTVPLKLKEKEIETPLTRRFKPLPMPKKAEEERPLVSLLFENETVPLAFGSSLPTAAGKGEFLLKLEPEKRKLPEKIRLKNATAEFYPNSEQAKGYRAKILWGKTPVELAMNRVWESPEGYRLYLANMTPLDETDVKEVRLVVNRDPFKYLLTYPGGVILAIGIALLFFRFRL
ncbi:MAG: hypothetical protein KDK62_06235 [Chlamydiia bacterium]|nr:hypothetical protein [Chlamydiia bacterium]